ncbi:hypothetical protein Tdes44962_MAKER05687 [Teratosphaeria destructans]|uniref:Uncharacterized protein n=1 Tax=Teratosphaeria destructans TaxID=418781 RepID=A0A9W7SJG5_9PEZI|nr:hypothetical protein Tdes44962_MAKER05687 [Teratosphaeria destructans]
MTDNQEAQSPLELEPDPGWTLVEQEALSSTDSASPSDQTLADVRAEVLRKELVRHMLRFQP